MLRKVRALIGSYIGVIKYQGVELFEKIKRYGHLGVGVAL